MVDIIKKDMTDIWAVAGDVVAPTSSKVRAGWAVEAVPRQWWNWFENRQDTNIAYMLQKGIPEWDQFTEYLTNKSYVQRNNIVYKCILTGVNKDPATTPANWVKAFPESTPYLELIKTLATTANRVAYTNAAGVAQLMPWAATGQQMLAAATPAAGRTVIDAQQASSNLTALSAITAATNALPYFTGTTTAGTTILTSFGRTILAGTDAASVRSILGLATGATTTMQANTSDTTVGRGLIFGAFGLGSSTGFAIPGNDLDNIINTGMYSVGGSTLNQPPSGGSGSTCLHMGFSELACEQLFMHYATAMSHRRKVNGVWQPWVRVWDEVNLVKTTSGMDSTLGRMLKVGDFGVGSTAASATTAGDLDTLTATGIYGIGSGTTNVPSGALSGSMCLNLVFNVSNMEQIVTSRTTDRMWFRRLNAGAWQPWVEFYHTGNVSALTGTITADITSNVNAQLALKQDSAAVQVTTGPTDNVDPNTLTIPWALVRNPTNTPDSGRFWYINTIWYQSKASGSISQTAIENVVVGAPRTFVRVASGGTWTAWVRTDGNAVAPTATSLATARTINGVSFNGTANINVPSIFATGETVSGPGIISLRAVGNPSGVAYDARVQLEAPATSGLQGTGVINLVASNVRSTGSFTTGSWFGSTGASGWVNNTYGGGIYQTDSTWVKVYGGKSFQCAATIQADGGFVGGGANITNIQHSNIGGVPQSQLANGWAMLPGGVIIQWMKATSSSSATDFKFFPRSFPTACTSVSCCIDSGAMGDAAQYGLNMRIVDNTKFVSVQSGQYVNNGVAFVIAIGY